MAPTLGGHAIPKCICLQDKYSIPYIIRTIRWDGILAKDLLQTLNASQLVAGFTTPTLEQTGLRIDYIGKGWIPHIYDRLTKLKGKMWIESAWSPDLQREFDSSIMAQFTTIPKISLSMLIKANECRIHLRVITIAELADINGSTISFDKLNGRWRAISALEWPNQPPPSKQHWAAWRKWAYT